MALHGIEEELFPEFSKLSGRKVGEAAGVASPRLLDGPIGVTDLRLDEYGDDFVIKPNWGTSSRGVLVLHRESDSVFFSVIDGIRLGIDEVHSRLLRDIQRSGRGSTDDLVVEESMSVGGIPTQEWKVSTFYGQVGLIQQFERSEKGLLTKTYSPEWVDLGEVYRRRKVTQTLVPPAAPEKLMEAAIAISLQVPTGFLRVDLYETPDGGVVLGELCLIPGGDRYFRGGLDKKLGRMWEDANVRLLSDGKTLIP
ncbi:teichuronopeptide biosynthesis [Leifsonia rubra CMS 76R]|nr:teichuronopeptide biosynthesis [Leifsonia rubra CMS 76R]